MSGPVQAPSAAQPSTVQSSAAQPSAERVAAARRVGTQFEAMALAQFLQPMFATVDMSRSIFGGGSGEAMFRPMLVDEMAKSFADQGGIGLAEAITREILRMESNGR